MYWAHDKRKWYSLFRVRLVDCYDFHPVCPLYSYFFFWQVIFVAVWTRHLKKKVYDLWAVTRFPRHRIIPECHGPFYNGTVKQTLYLLVHPKSLRRSAFDVEWVNTFGAYNTASCAGWATSTKLLLEGLPRGFSAGGDLLLFQERSFVVCFPERWSSPSFYNCNWHLNRSQLQHCNYANKTFINKLNDFKMNRQHFQ